MEQPLTIKDLNCGNCPNDRSCSVHPTWPIEGLPQAEQREITTIRDYTSKCGCLRHPSALQVLAGPIIAELEKLKDKARLRSNEMMDRGNDGNWDSGKEDAFEEAIKLLKEGVQ